MKKLTLLFAAMLLLTTVACKKDKKEAVTETEAVENTTTSSDDNINRDRINTTSNSNDSANMETKKVIVKMEAKSGSSVTGSAVFKQEKGIVSMIALFGGLDEGSHAIHLHEKADCSSDDGKSTGGHWNPTAQQHGKWGDDTGYHKGDIGNFTANEKGHGTITFSTNEWCIGCGDPAKDILGKAVIVHQGTDDFKSQPSGAAGSRISCGGVIE